MSPRLKPEIDIASANAIGLLFEFQVLGYGLSRMASKRDKDDLVTHPLRRPILVEMKDNLVVMISRQIAAGLWSPAPAYLCLTHKRSGNHRELVFPSLIDSIVGRQVIDALEPFITADDHGQAFCGRSHASSHREPGDYDNWFQTWLDYSSAIAAAARREGFAYVYDTDVADFFPSVDRTKAKQFLSQRTRAHPSLLELLFFCLESWLPRFEYMPMQGIPIEPNDVSRLVAHNYVKVVDAEFTMRSDARYLRYVDDTTIFVKTAEAAEEAKREHHMALRRVGLNPNEAKSEILPVEQYEARRHSEFNKRIDRDSNDEGSFKGLVFEWYRRPSRKRLGNWDRIAKRLYKAAIRNRFPNMRRRVPSDLETHPELTGVALEYLSNFQKVDAYLDRILRRWNSAGMEQKIHIARFVCDGSFSLKASAQIAQFAVKKIQRPDDCPGSGYAKGLLVLALNKHGERKHRDKVLSWAAPDTLVDEQLRLHFLYVFACRKELSPELRLTLVQLASSDIDLTLRLCDRALRGEIANRKSILKLFVRGVGASLTVEARYLPLLAIMCESKQDALDMITWIDKLLTPNRVSHRKVDDPVLRRILTGLRDRLAL